MCCPGRVYRRDALDRLHAAEPHQLDLWRIRAGVLGGEELESMITHVLDAVRPGAELRTTPATHPYTRDGLQLGVRAGDRWVEIGECGVALPALLEECGLPPGGHAGLNQPRSEEGAVACGPAPPSRSRRSRPAQARGSGPR